MGIFMNPKDIARLITEDPDVIDLEAIAEGVRDHALKLGITLPPTQVLWTERDTSFFDKDIHISRMDAEDAFKVIAHEFGHVLYNMLSEEEQNTWFEEVNKIFGGALNPPHGDEVYARTFQHIMAGQTNQPHYEARAQLFDKFTQ
jgi:hypothetical protein